MKFSLFSAVLFSIGWMSVVGTVDGPEPSCCLTVTDTRIPVENIVKYEMQDPPLCNTRAVRFHSKKNIIICSDPDSKYAKRVMDIVDGRTTTKRIMCSTSTTNTIPAVTTTNETPATQTETSKSTTTSRIVTRIETSRPETETSTSTTVSRKVTRTETSRPETVITKITNQPTPMSKENPESSLRTATTCGTGGPTSPSKETRGETPGPGTVTHLNTLKTTDNTETTSPSTETRRKTPGPGTFTHLNTLKTTNNTETTSPMRKKPSKLELKILSRKSKKNLKKFQMNINPKDKTG